MPEGPGPRVTELPLDAIKLPKERQKRYDKEDEKNRHFIESLQKVGLINPVDVRQGEGDKYELVMGRKRLWAARQLGWKTILARVGDWSDAQLGFLQIAENLHRDQMSPAQQGLANQALMREFQLAFGPDPGRAAGGYARAAKAGRDNLQQFASNDVAADESYSNTDPALGMNPASGAPPDAGSEDESQQPATAPRAHSVILADAIGKDHTGARQDLKIAKAFTPEQLQALDVTQVSKADLLKIAKVADVERRHQVVNRVCFGDTADEAIAALCTPENGQEKDAAYLELKERKISDEDWVREHGGKVRIMLQDPTVFDREALLYRHTRDDRLLLRSKCKAEVLKCHEAGGGPLSYHLRRILWVNHPSTWLRCWACEGRNVDKPECEDCHGCGFKLNYDFPRKSKNKE